MPALLAGAVAAHAQPTSANGGLSPRLDSRSKRRFDRRQFETQFT
jgi:hypothetical protein